MYSGKDIPILAYIQCQAQYHVVKDSIQALEASICKPSRVDVYSDLAFEWEYLGVRGC